LSPWSTCLMAQQRLVLRRTNGIKAQSEPKQRDKAGMHAPSSTLALRYLSDFCTLHGIYGQSLAGLAATLLIPYNSASTTKRVLLPKPRFLSTPQNLPKQIADIRQQGELIPFYMSLSCHVHGIRSLLVGSFFESTVPCNLVHHEVMGTLLWSSRSQTQQRRRRFEQLQAHLRSRGRCSCPLSAAGDLCCARTMPASFIIDTLPAHVRDPV
jgi:hypothetical protein